MSNNIRYDLLNNKEWLIQKYVEEKLTQEEIGKLCNCSIFPVSKKLKEFDINIRSRCKAKNSNIREELLNKDWLYQKYIVEKLNTIEIAEICKCGDTLISNKLKEFNIGIRPPNEARNLNINWNLLNNKGWLYKKYIEEKLSTYQIAEICKCGESLIGRQLKKFNIEIRRGGESLNPNVKWDLLNNKEWLQQKYVNKKLSIIKIAKICNCSHSTVFCKLKEFDIKIKSRSEFRNSSIKWDLLNDKEWLEQKYLTEKFNSCQIAKICKCSSTFVCEQLKKLNIKVRSYNEFRNPNAKWDLLNDKEWLEQKYITEKLSARKIANICNCSYNLVLTQLNNFDIETRSCGGGQNPFAKWNLLNNKKWLKQKYINEKLSFIDIAKICKCSSSTINRQLKKFNIPTREIKGENHPAWKGGISFDPYCSKFNNKLKEYIRETFDRKCFLCGKLEKDNNSRLHVHHVDYNKSQGCGYSWSLIPLCQNCHAKTNHNRYYWFNLLNNYWLLNSEINFNQIIFYPIR